MNAQDLKNSILQLAIQGKLVEQREEEGTAEQLYQQVEEKKKDLIERGKFAKKKKVPCITEEEKPFEIPQSWKWVRFGHIANIVSSRRVHKSDWRDRGIPFYRAREIAKLSEYGSVNNELFIDESLYDQLSQNGIPTPGDLMITAVGTLGKSYVVKENDIFYYKDASVICLENIFKLDPNFLKVIMESIFMKKQIEKNSSGTTVSTLTISRMNNYILPLIPIEEQKRIVAKIEELIPLIEQYDKAYTDVMELNEKFPVEMEKSILQYAIKGKLVEQRKEEGTAEELYKQIQVEKQRLIEEGKIKKQKKLPEITEEEIPFEIPEGWKWVRLDDIGFTNIGLTYKAKDISNEGTIVLRSSNIQNGRLDFNDIVKITGEIPDNKMCQVGDILICARNGSKRLVGKSALIDREGLSFGAFMAVYRSVCNEYLLYVINSPYIRKTMLPDTSTTTINQITQGRLKNLVVPLPPLEEQKRIVKKVEELLPHTRQLTK